MTDLNLRPIPLLEEARDDMTMTKTRRGAMPRRSFMNTVPRTPTPVNPGAMNASATPTAMPINMRTIRLEFRDDFIIETCKLLQTAKWRSSDYGLAGFG